MKYLISVIAVVSLFSCTPGGKKSQSAGASDDGDTTVPANTDSDIGVEAIERNVVVRTFNEYNSALSMATGVSVSHDAIINEFNSIKNSLPANNSASTFSSFSQVSALRLSFSYCDVYVNESDIWKNYDFANYDDNVILNMLMENLLDYDSSKSADVQKFSELRSKLEDIIKNKPVDGKVLVESTDGGTDSVKKRLTTMTCSAILSSSYYTVL